MGFLRTAVIPLRNARWLLLALLAASSLVAIFGDAGRAVMSYDREAIHEFELWRLFSAHVAHLGWLHFLMNAGGLVLILVLVGTAFSAGTWFVVVVASALTIDAGLWFFDPHVSNYVGLSGVLHGLLAAGLLRSTAKRPVESALLAIVLVAKLGYEQVVGPIPGSEGSAGGTVIVDAHLYGALGGLVAAVIVAGLERRASV